jgi:hypothetical protein
MRVSPIFVVIAIDNPTQETSWQARSCRVSLAFYPLMEYDALKWTNHESMSTPTLAR